MSTLSVLAEGAPAALADLICRRIPRDALSMCFMCIELTSLCRFVRLRSVQDRSGGAVDGRREQSRLAIVVVVVHIVDLVDLVVGYRLFVSLTYLLSSMLEETDMVCIIAICHVIAATIITQRRSA